MNIQIYEYTNIQIYEYLINKINIYNILYI